MNAGILASSSLVSFLGAGFKLGSTGYCFDVTVIAAPATAAAKTISIIRLSHLKRVHLPGYQLEKPVWPLKFNIRIENITGLGYFCALGDSMFEKSTPHLQFWPQLFFDVRLL